MATRRSVGGIARRFRCPTGGRRSSEPVAARVEDDRGIVAIVDDRVHDGGRRVLHVVTDQTAPGKEKSTSGHMSATGVARQALESTHVVVGHETDGAAEEVGQVARRVGPVASKDVTECVQGSERGGRRRRCPSTTSRRRGSSPASGDRVR